MRRTLAALLLLLAFLPPQAQAQVPACTLTIGFSQTRNWWYGGDLVHGYVYAMPRGSQELLWQGGGAIDLWADPSYVGWTAPIERPCATNPTQPDRVLLTISAERYESDPAWWQPQIAGAIAQVRAHYPSASEIVLQSVVGGPGGASCSYGGSQVRATYNQAAIVQAIDGLVGGDVTAGMVPSVLQCADFADSIGHLVKGTRDATGQRIAAYYLGAPQPTPTPTATPTPTPGCN